MRTYMFLRASQVSSPNTYGSETLFFGKIKNAYYALLM
jgi:hypothetical protein